MRTSPYHALIRFGLGRRADEPLPDDPAAWLATQLAGADPTHDGPGIGTDAAVRVLRDERPGTVKQGPKVARQAIQQAIAALLTTPTPFRERLVWFWANHFTVSLRRPELAALAGAFVRDAIRPRVTGRFADMLLAAMRHPAMLIYLDNHQSYGPRSPYGLRHGGRPSENLARECLELHTLGGDGSFSQDDVTGLARVLTGWSPDLSVDPPRAFAFRQHLHEPGPKTVLGRTWPEGEAGGEAVLRFLAEQPATARHLATRLVRHFVADPPPADSVARVAAVLADTGGNLAAAALAVTREPAAWTPLTRFRTPVDFLVAALRAIDPPPSRRPDAAEALAALGQPLMAAPQPCGWSDTDAAWATPAGLLRRMERADAWAGLPTARTADALADDALGPLLKPATRAAMRAAGTHREQVAVLLGCPEFQRR